ncbi:MAG: leucine-rich repeat protein [Clostridia bacterium]|nr:leucine-rich repeat protein [Clostridia bacterium]
MKKTLALLLCILLCVPCALAAEDDDLIGAWVLTRYAVDGRVIEHPAAAGSNKVVLFEADGSAVVTINENVYYGTWTAEGDRLHLLYEDGDQADFKMEDGQLVYRPEGQIQYFTRQVVYAEAADFVWRKLSDDSAEIIGYTGSASTLNIPSELDGYPVRVIGTAAFASHEELLSVTLPAGIDTIKPFAFMGCSRLFRISLPAGLTRIGTSAFQGCENLGSIAIPEGIDTLEYAVFQGCASLRAAGLPRSLRLIEAQAFADCDSLKGIVIPAGVETLADAAFSGCASMAEAIFPASLSAIYGAPFAGCEGLAFIAPPNSYAAGWLAQNR